MSSSNGFLRIVATDGNGVFVGWISSWCRSSLQITLQDDTGDWVGETVEEAPWWTLQDIFVMG